MASSYWQMTRAQKTRILKPGNAAHLEVRELLVLEVQIMAEWCYGAFT